jgi:TrkA domain protein
VQIREVELPGVGKKFALVSSDGERLTIIIHNTGTREIYNFRRGEDFPFHALRLDDEEARQLSAILGGAYFQPAGSASMDLLLEQLAIEWVKITDESPITGRSIAELDVRKQTGASVLALLRARQVIPNPQPDEHILAGDTVVVAGTHDQVNRFLAFARGA